MIEFPKNSQVFQFKEYNLFKRYDLSLQGFKFAFLHIRKANAKSLNLI